MVLVPFVLFLLGDFTHNQSILHIDLFHLLWLVEPSTQQLSRELIFRQLCQIGFRTRYSAPNDIDDGL